MALMVLSCSSSPVVSSTRPLLAAVMFSAAGVAIRAAILRRSCVSGDTFGGWAPGKEELFEASRKGNKERSRAYFALSLKYATKEVIKERKRRPLKAAKDRQR